ncbi:glycoside hydrolase family 47 protein [Myriangium duriaei CBS 260.36]|uniref:alpha-1,2-Mannosidase n=1 Tax=Myriangium duriaei CBS 260.36 TaxID=1168546 RepID=A0A9P4JEI5_9PEZI|nr:glycoside hydrolase family 47 protein [Myriangium duriaei CBS 260.36]
MLLCSRPLLKLAIALFTFFVFATLTSDVPVHSRAFRFARPLTSFHWRDVKLRYPVDAIRPLPSGPPQNIPRVQFDFPTESQSERAEREERQKIVRDTFLHAWNGYKSHAWLKDEVSPISGGSENGFGGWGATLVDSLDTLWIMGLKKEFNKAVTALDRIDFSSCAINRISVFETNIRYLGGLLSAYDLSGRKYKKILHKAVEVGDMLYLAFDTPNHMPVSFWFWETAKQGGFNPEPYSAVLAEYGSFSLEFTRLSQITGDPKYYDAMARVMDVFEAQQNSTKVPGLWPVNLKPSSKVFTDDTKFTLGASADSMYEYLPKQHLLINGRTDSYKKMYTSAIEAAKENLFFRALSPNDTEIMFSGISSGSSLDTLRHESISEHLTCFVGGMVGLGAKIFSREEDLKIARQLTDGCIWAYDMMPTGIMPEIFTVQRCGNSYASKLKGDGNPGCEWSQEKWFKALVDADSIWNPPENKDTPLEEQARQVVLSKKLRPGFINIRDPRYLLRPEAIESVFVMYRITGDRSLLNAGWRMFQSIAKHTKTNIAHAGIKDVSVEKPVQEDKMESFWLGETLKYFYLLFSEPDLISLDDFVLNTEAHPLLRERT